MPPHVRPLSFLLLLCILITGCGREIHEFPPNRVYAAKLAKDSGSAVAIAVQDSHEIVTGLFGTPNAPQWPIDKLDASGGATLVDLERLEWAAGAVSSDRQGNHRGLYREHCATCHGISGSGVGPTASFMNPYPRDFRAGVFKFKSTPRGAKPTRDDLLRILRSGIPGSAMPAFHLLPEDELQDLVDYVIYLSIRGELERKLLYEAVMELGYDDQAPAAADRLLAPELQVSEPDVYQEQTQWLNGQVIGLVESWRKASEKVAAVPSPPIPLVSSTSLADPTVAESVARGERIYRGPIANCATCHGVSGRGDGITKDYDEWTKEWTIRSGLSPGDSIGVKPFLRAGALPPRNVLPRNLRLGVFRGGSTPEDIYRRITHGIEGTPMPAVNLVEQPSGTGLTTAEVWDLVNFVLSLSLESGQRALLGERS